MSQQSAAYELVNDYLDIPQGQPAPTGTTDVSTSPYWVLAIWRLRYPLTFDRRTMKSTIQTPDLGVSIFGSPLIITDECLSMEVETNKSSYIGTLLVQLSPGTMHWLSEVYPKDWCAAWMFNDQDSAYKLVQTLQSGNLDGGGFGSVINGFYSGLKFYGKVSSIRKVLAVQQQGLKTVSYRLQANMGKEFDSSVFYEAGLEQQLPGLGQWISRVGENFDKLISISAQGMKTMDVIPQLLNTFYGSGVPQSFTNSGAQPLQVTTGGGSSAEAPYAFILPTFLGNFFGKNTNSKAGGILSFADILEVTLGIQKYQQGQAQASPSMVQQPQALFTPQNLVQDPSYTNTLPNGNLQKTGTDLLGVFPAEKPEVFNKSVWSCLQQYLNPVINEMFYTLRCNGQGCITPQLIIRQIPFTTESYAQQQQTQATSGYIYGLGPEATAQLTSNVTSAVTRFLEVPRWRVHPVLVDTADLGRSDAEHFNFFHIYGQAGLTSPLTDMTVQLVQNPPIRDDADIMRSGPSNFQQMVPASQKDILGGGPAIWMGLAADFHLGSEFCLNGTLNLLGVQAPICIGDNLEFDGAVFHIESVLHSCRIAPGGVKTFYTSLQLSHGMRSDLSGLSTGPQPQAESTQTAAESPFDTDLGLYPSVFSDDQTDFEPGLTVETDGNNTTDKPSRNGPGPSEQVS